ncbi:MAG: hypothetical protein OXH09_11115 [Gammaproteobacteria bacterium]|nr:hypothetical protein [Gammaproteobacteria bacterium]
MYRDGFVVLPGQIETDRVAAARQLILEQPERPRTAAAKVRTGNETHASWQLGYPRLQAIT